MKLKRFSIGYRTMKTAAGAAVAIYVAQLLQLDYFVSAGILAMLCIQPTKKRSIRAAFSRFVASLIGIGFAFIFFEGAAFHPAVFGLLILLFIPTLVSFGFSDGFISSAVILLHIYDSKNLTMDLFFNELALMAVGFGTALAANTYMPSIEKRLDAYRNEIESLYSTIFKETAIYLRKGDSDWTGKELMESEALLQKAKALAYQDVENHVTRLENKYYRYFDMREQQLEIIERILPKITALPVMIGHSSLVAEFLEDLSAHIHSGNTASHYLNKLKAVKDEFAAMPLPDSHPKFLAMAALYQVIEEMEAYLEIKSSYKGFTNKKAAEA